MFSETKTNEVVTSGIRNEVKEITSGHRSSMGGSPLDSDVEEDEEDNGEGRGSDDDGHQDINNTNRKKKTRTVFSRHQVFKKIFLCNFSSGIPSRTDI